ncbi:hypothetical protein L3N51_02359 [Metallosphaera sp. J1]|uniref:hypothetical protein n=1 Tax=Metallosphaera javensis (ex Hofmann et al. 2022) TaxID=99938 RepID=UPI001EDFDF70|nr:hypothetical protein [Metallosphaera javensis (ex Hofmann et al. 2022)]MCG3110062.1 hypothetical protein [Metallosphaera javensis (ex Hofmann et al. 2022)]
MGISPARRYRDYFAVSSVLTTLMYVLLFRVGMGRYPDSLALMLRGEPLSSPVPLILSLAVFSPALLVLSGKPFNRVLPALLYAVCLTLTPLLGLPHPFILILYVMVRYRVPLLGILPLLYLAYLVYRIIRGLPLEWARFFVIYQGRKPLNPSPLIPFLLTYPFLSFLGETLAYLIGSSPDTSGSSPLYATVRYSLIYSCALLALILISFILSYDAMSLSTRWGYTPRDVRVRGLHYDVVVEGNRMIIDADSCVYLPSYTLKRVEELTRGIHLVEYQGHSLDEVHDLRLKRVILYKLALKLRRMEGMGYFAPRITPDMVYLDRSVSTLEDAVHADVRLDPRLISSSGSDVEFICREARLTCGKLDEVIERLRSFDEVRADHLDLWRGEQVYPRVWSSTLEGKRVLVTEMDEEYFLRRNSLNVVMQGEGLLVTEYAQPLNSVDPRLRFVLYLRLLKFLKELHAKRISAPLLEEYGVYLDREMKTKEDALNAEFLLHPLSLSWGKDESDLRQVCARLNEILRIDCSLAERVKPPEYRILGFRGPFIEIDYGGRRALLTYFEVRPVTLELPHLVETLDLYVSDHGMMVTEDIPWLRVEDDRAKLLLYLRLARTLEELHSSGYVAPFLFEYGLFSRDQIRSPEDVLNVEIKFHPLALVKGSARMGNVIADEDYDREQICRRIVRVLKTFRECGDMGEIVRRLSEIAGVVNEPLRTRGDPKAS